MADKFLWKPVSPFYVGQQFGESKACCEDNGLPIQKRKVVSKNANGTCPVGYVELYPLLGMKGHTGLDISVPRGTRCYAAHDGVVEEVQTEVERGLGVGVVSEETFNLDIYRKHRVKTRYWHLMSIDVKIGQKVKAGDSLGQCDNTGVSSGDHLHWELKPVQITSGGLTNVYQTNGFFGAIDPVPFLNGYFAKDAPQVFSLMKTTITLLENLLAYLKK